MLDIRENVSLHSCTTLRAGGRAAKFARAFSLADLADMAIWAQSHDLEVTTLGWGSNVLPSDAGVPGFVLQNSTSNIELTPAGDVQCDSGVGFQELFLKTAQAGLKGLEYAVGIPGTVGGALVSNAGAYRSNISEFLTGIEIVFEGVQQWVDPSWMEFSYRDSRLRRPDPVRCTLLQIRMKLEPGDPKAIYDEARDYQRQRIGKQPPPASAGSFFKNVHDAALAERLETLPPNLKKIGLVPAGYLIQEAKLAGHRLGGAMFATRHANFMLNVAGATASDIRSLASLARKRVFEEYGAELEEEVLYLGDWSGWEPVLG
ncbi:MAG: UDP-N-acetylmuramate dehydrogenase [Chthonomonas sp.]|nr:UDP-N-acetylmuramate dehydrogenase [Chthonomonas sp.]